MKQKRMTVIAIACGVVCVLCVGLFMLSVHNEANAARAEALARYGGEQVEVCVAARDIPAGERVEPSALETKLWVADLLPEEAVSASGDVVGKTATSDIIKGEVLTSRRFDLERSTIDVPAGKEAVSVPAKAVQAVGGALAAGMVVDVYSSGGSGTVALDREVLVLASSVGSGSSLTSGGAGWITLAVDPGKVEEFVAASTKTDLYFVLPGDRVEAGGASGAQPAAKGPEGDSAESAEADGAAPDAGASAANGEGLASAGASDGEAAAGGEGEPGAAGGEGSSAPDDFENAQESTQDAGDAAEGGNR